MITPGIKNHLELTVAEEHTASKVGSGLANVLATPMMITLIEKTCHESVLPLLPEGQSTVGTHIDVEHSAATPMGMKVWCDSELVAVEGRRLLFNMACYDTCGPIGKGTHERFIVDSARFQAKADSKAATLKG